MDSAVSFHVTRLSVLDIILLSFIGHYRHCLGPFDNVESRTALRTFDVVLTVSYRGSIWCLVFCKESPAKVPTLLLEMFDVIDNEKPKSLLHLHLCNHFAKHSLFLLFLKKEIIYLSSLNFICHFWDEDNSFSRSFCLYFNHSLVSPHVLFLIR